MKRRRICVITGSRAEFGNLKRLMKEIKQDPGLDLQVIVTGAHLSPEYGLTYKEIEENNFCVNKMIEMLLSSNTEIGTLKSLGLAIISMGEAYKELKPDVVVYLGDRYEILAAGIAALILKIPTAHISGGETTPAVMDEGIRHSLTKLSLWHFPSNDIYRKRIVQMGEHPDRVFNCGYVGLDDIYDMEFLSEESLSESLNFDMSGGFAICTYHPVSSESSTTAKQIESILSVIEEYDFKVIFTKANADPGGRIINEVIEDFCKRDFKKYILVESLGKVRYLSALKKARIIIGNSSTGIVEAPSFHIPAVNVGDRQFGRIKAESVIDCGYDRKSIREAINKALDRNYRSKIKHCNNPYDKYKDGKASCRIKEILKEIVLDEGNIKKAFYDIDFKL